MNFLLSPFPLSLLSPSCTAACALPDARCPPSALQHPGDKVTLVWWQRVAASHWATAASLVGDCGTLLTAGMVALHMGNTHSCSQPLCFWLLWPWAILAQGIPPWGCHLLRCKASGCEEVMQKQPAPLARHCLISSKQVSQKTQGLAGEKIQIFIDLPSSFAFSQQKRFRTLIYLFQYSELNIVAKIRYGRQPGRVRCNKIQ